MRRGHAYKAFVYFVCFSFLFLMSGFPTVLAQAEEKGFPVGEMISRGEVKFESRDDVWEKVESSQFPIFQEMTVRTDKGDALIALVDGSQVEVGHDSIFFFQNYDEFHLSQGQASFRIPPGAELTMKAGELAIGKPYPIHASENPVMVSPTGQETVGSVTLHPNGSVTVTNIRGPLSVQNHERVVVASISPGESVTIPSSTASGGQGVMVAQVGEFGMEGEVPLGFETWEMFFLAMGAGAVVAGGLTWAIIEAADDDDDDIVIITSP